MLGAAGYVWYEKIFTNEERIFYGMLAKSLETDSISRTVTQESTGRQERQTFFLNFTPTPLVETSSFVKQVDKNRQDSIVETNTIGTRESDLVRYTNITLAPGSTDTNDYSKVVNTWAKRDGSAENSQGAQFLNEAIFTFIPFGNFPQAQREELLKIIKEKEVYKLTNDAKISYENGRPYYTNLIQIKPRGLVEVLKKYNELTGIGDPTVLDPQQYEDVHSFGMKIKVDLLSRHLVEINYPGETRSEIYDAYGLNRPVEIPTETISIEELQSRLQ